MLYEYDSASRLIQRVEGGTTTNYTWDGWDLIREVKTGTISETTNYLVPMGEVLAFERGGDWYYMHRDSLSSTQLVTDENGDQVGRFIYGAWGEELYSSESIPGVLENRFVGGYGCRRDAATGLVLMRHRWYDPQLQRFISRDKIRSANRYQYAECNPTIYMDITGLLAVLDPSLAAFCDKLMPGTNFAELWAEAVKMAIGMAQFMKRNAGIFKGYEALYGPGGIVGKGNVPRDCAYPNDIDYLVVLEGNLDVNFNLAPPDVMADLEDPNGYPIAWQVQGHKGEPDLVFGSSFACTASAKELARNIIHELTHSGIYFIHSKDGKNPYTADRAGEGPPGNPSHPRRYFGRGLECTPVSGPSLF